VVHRRRQSFYGLTARFLTEAMVNRAATPLLIPIQISSFRRVCRPNNLSSCPASMAPHTPALNPIIRPQRTRPSGSANRPLLSRPPRPMADAVVCTSQALAAQDAANVTRLTHCRGLCSAEDIPGRPTQPNNSTHKPIRIPIPPTDSGKHYIPEVYRSKERE
jgi:hypothetical protein